MNEPTMDDKIQQLVTAVLEAVDARLDAIRHELVQFATDADQRHHDVLATLATLERRVEHLEARPTAVPTPIDQHQSVADLNERMAQATKILVERMEAAHHEAALATDRKVAQLATEIEALRNAAPAAPVTPIDAEVPAPLPLVAPASVEPPSHSPAPAMSGSFGHVTGQLPHLADATLDEISRPLFEHGHVTGPTPTVSDTGRLRQMTAPPMPPVVTPSMSPVGSVPVDAAHAAHDEIDIARLTSLINDQLDHFSLPNRPE